MENTFDEQKCRICGCTWNNACDGGCWWVEDDLCSTCFSKVGEIKFRAIPKEEFNNREIVLDSMAYYSQETEYDGTFIYGYLADGYIIGETIDADEDYYHPMFWVPIERKTVGQYTGFNIKNKEIYQSDILQITIEDPDEGTLTDNGIVKMSNEGCWIVEVGTGEELLWDWMMEDIKIIGNIYTNTELLEG